MSRQSSKPVTAQEQLEMDIMAESELARLQRQYRIMDADRIAFQDESSVLMQKQRRVVNVLRKEIVDINRDLVIAASKNNKRKDTETLLQIQRLLQESDKFDQAVKKQKNDLREIDYQIKKVGKDVLIYRKKQVTDEQMQRRVLESRRSIDALQNKLDHNVKKFGTLLSENKVLREEIDHLLRERNIFNKLWEHQLEVLHSGKRIMMDLVEQATIAYDQREEWCHKLQALRLRAHNDLLAHMSEMRELFRQLDHDTSLQDFLSIKGQKRILKDLEKKEQMKRQLARENLEKQLLHYRQTLAKVQEIAEEEDISKLTAQYIKQEEENFALFNYVNELNHELETLTDNISGLYISIDEQKEINERRAQQQKDTIESLREELRKAQEEERAKKQLLLMKQMEQERILKGIEGLFKLVRCDNTPLLNLLGETGTITNYNVLVYLSILENRVTELLMLTNYRDKTLKKSPSQRNLKILPKRSSSRRLVKIPTRTPCPLCAELFETEARLSNAMTVRSIKEICEYQYGGHLDQDVLHGQAQCSIHDYHKSTTHLPSLGLKVQNK